MATIGIALKHFLMIHACEENKRWKLKTLFEYTGYTDSDAMRKANRDNEIIENAAHFFRKASDPSVMLNCKYKYIYNH